MILAVDIGNTYITFAVAQEKNITRTGSVLVIKNKTKLATDIREVALRVKRKYSIHGVIICSVVPEVLKITEIVLRRILARKILIVGKNLKVPIKNKYRVTKQVGQDRLVCAFAASALYGTPAIIIDFGTAITLDVVSKSRAHEGGIIVPGITLSAQSLNQRTALLPKVNIKEPIELIGRDTTNSILSGIFYGFGSLCDGLVKLLAGKLTRTPVVVATGGYVDLMKKYTKSIEIVDPDLIFRGLLLLSNQKSI